MDDVSLQIGQRRTLGLVGESGSGKTTAARCIVGLVERTGGQVTLFDIALAPGLDQRDAAVLRRLQMVFQNPEEALNPHRTVGDVLQRPLMRLMGLSAAEARQQAGLIATIRAIKARFPDAKLIFNRGFEILPKVHDLAWICLLYTSPSPRD